MKSRVSKITNKEKKYTILEHFVTLGELFLLGSGVLTAFLYYSHYEKVLGNTASRLLLALGPHLGLGRPYTDLWEFAPPGFLVVADAWIRVFGWSMNSFRLLQVLLLSVAGVSFLLVIRKIFKYRLLELVIFSSFVLILYSPVLQSDILSIELFGLTFSLLGLVALLYLKRPTSKLAISAFLFFFASQMKETFTFSILALVPYYFNQLRRNGFISLAKPVLVGALGPLVGVAIIFSYLLSVDALSGYKQVLEYKLTIARPIGSLGSLVAGFNFIESMFSENFLHWHRYASRLLFINIVIIYYYRYLRIKISKFSKKTIELLIQIKRGHFGAWESWSAILFSLGLIIGIVMYGQYSVDTRQIPVNAAIFIIFGILLKNPFSVAYRFLHKRSNAIVATVLTGMFLFVLLSPQVKIIKSFFHQIRLHISGELLRNEESRKYYLMAPSFEVTDYIASKTSPNDCILNPYGWEVAETYIYSQRKPCSRHFLANLLIQNEWQIEEYKRQILNNPPAAILYNLNIIDLNVENFEKKVINYSDILKHCYYLDLKYRQYPYVIMSLITHIDVYWQRTDMNEQEFRGCFQKYAQTEEQ